MRDSAKPCHPPGSLAPSGISGAEFSADRQPRGDRAFGRGLGIIFHITRPTKKRTSGAAHQLSRFCSWPRPDGLWHRAALSFGCTHFRHADGFVRGAPRPSVFVSSAQNQTAFSIPFGSVRSVVGIAIDIALLIALSRVEERSIPLNRLRVDPVLIGN